MIEVNFNESVNYLLSLGNEVSAMKLGLDNIRKLLAELGNPHESYLKVQVAGTNGKGSVCAFLDSICVTAGIRTGTFTSPHLISITERVRINGVDISEDDFARRATFVRETAENLLSKGELEYRPTFFEQITAIALVAFADARVELAILETGLGGRLDATTAANAEIAAITRIDLDHQEYLGNTIEEIAAEKAAIIHKGSKVVVGEQNDVAMQVIIRRCSDVGVVPILASKEAHSLPVVFPPLGPTPIRMGLLGSHQIDNAKVVIRLAETLQQHFAITKQNIIDGLENARHPGRLEFHGQYLFDGAHNVGGATALRAFLDEFVDQPITMIFGVMKEKNVSKIAEALFPKAGNVILTRPENSRALTGEQITESLPAGLNPETIFITESVSDAIAKANEVICDNGIILVTGSLYLVGEVKKLLKENSRI